jgi:hypothetical protein
MSLKDVLDTMHHEFRLRYAGRYYGKYRAIVRDNQDPAGLGRIKVQVPVLFGGATSSWCWPAMPFGGNNRDAPHGAVFIPDVGDMVWVELEEGNTQKPPIWTAGMWSTESVPDHARALPDEADNNSVKGHPGGVIPESTFNATETGKVRIIQMPSGSRLEFDDTEGTERVQLYHKSGAHLEIMQDGTVNLGAVENLRLQATAGILQTFAALAWEQIVNGPAFLTNEGDWQQTVNGSYLCEVKGDYTVKASTITMEMGGDTKNTFAGSLTELVLGKESRTVSNQASLMVGTDWFVQAAGGVGITAQNSATNGGIPTDLGIDFTAQNSRAVLQSTDATGLATKAILELNGTPGVANLDATVTVHLGSLVAAIEPIIKGLSYTSLMSTVLGLIDAHVHTCAAPGAPTTPPIPPVFASTYASGLAATLSVKSFTE